MNRIKLLPEGIAQRIAAGEVIERPVSVVKELVENSLDAAASRIAVELAAGGKNLIRVRDDGLGMSRADAEICFLRHSTSKIRSEADLEAIATLGFRGEALASISAVSRLTLRTSEGGDGPGTEIARDGDNTLSLRDIAFPRGTEIEVRDLFFNLPARRKFLRSDASELTLIARYLTNVALAYPSLRLSLAHGPRSVLNGLPAGGLRERIYQLFGKSAQERLMVVDFAAGGSRLFGFVSRPPSGKPNRNHQFFFVNRRPVRDKVMASALSQAMRGLLEKDLAPEAYLFLELPPGDVDVNVHPAKAEVRFRESSAVFQIVLRAIENARLGADVIKEIGALSAAASSAEALPSKDSGWISGIAEGKEPYSKPRGTLPEGQRVGEKPPGRRFLGQLALAYILAEDEEGLLIVDQHNAHERVLFERYSDIDERRQWPVTMSLIPLVFDLAPSQAVNLEAHLDILAESGFRVEAMGGRSYALREYPDIFKPDEAQDVVLSLLDEMNRVDSAGKKKKMLATLACKTAVKAGEYLPAEKCEFLLRELFETSNPGLCPHGRPIIVRVTKTQIEKGLRRPSA